MRIYKLSALLPREEFKLKVQMRDAARSLTNNIAEGHGRFSFKDRRRFITDARGSLQELIDDVNLCHDEGYAKAEHLQDLKDDALPLLKQLNGYMKFLRQQETSRSTDKASDPI